MYTNQIKEYSKSHSKERIIAEHTYLQFEKVQDNNESDIQK
ncbi:MAG TPA: hypothetical protein VIY08_04480 [Candidatus Nitrosocosmicus sp.]